MTIQRTYNMKKSLFILCLLAGSLWCGAQTSRTMTVEDGGTGQYHSVIVGDASLPDFTIYRPADLKAAVEKNGKLPVILYGNGACMNSSVEARYFLNEIASHGYVVVAIGPYNEADFIAHWKDVMKTMAPSGKPVVLANGEVVKPMTEAEKAEMMKAMQAQREAEQKAAARSRSKKNAPAPEVPVERRPTNPRQLLQALDWLTDRNADAASEYYHMLDLEKVSVMGQSCGGAQALGVTHDPRIASAIILNSGIADMSMQGVDKRQLANLHSPMLYIVGGDEDMATPNGTKDFNNIQGVPVVLLNTGVDGHEGSYYETHGGKYAQAVIKWLDWQMKGKVANAAFFLDEAVLNLTCPGWTTINKNFQ